MRGTNPFTVIDRHLGHTLTQFNRYICQVVFVVDAPKVVCQSKKYYTGPVGKSSLVLSCPSILSALAFPEHSNHGGVEPPLGRYHLLTLPVSLPLSTTVGTVSTREHSTATNIIIITLAHWHTEEPVHLCRLQTLSAARANQDVTSTNSKQSNSSIKKKLMQKIVIKTIHSSLMCV